MIRVEIEETIDRPPDVVFERLADIAAYPEWMGRGGLFITCTQDSEGPVGEGTLYSDMTLFGTIRGEVDTFDRPWEVVFHYSARLLGIKVMDGWPGYTLREGEGGVTELRHVAEGHLHGPFTLLRPLIQRLASHERRRTVDALKASWEPSPQPGADGHHS